MTGPSASFSVAVLTPRGRGAVAVVRVTGDPVHLERVVNECFQAANQRPFFEQPLGNIVYGKWGRDSREDVVTCRVTACTLEIHGHGGDRAVNRIVADWVTQGAQRQEAFDLVSQEQDPITAEIWQCLSRAVTWRTAEWLLRQADGRWQQALPAVTAVKSPSSVPLITEMLRWAEFGIHLSEPWKVVLTGRPNVGKSCLMNAMLGFQRSIVFDQPGTTRDVVTAETAFEGWPVQLIDTAGLRETAGPLEAEGISRAKQVVTEADLVIELIDVSEPPAEIVPPKRTSRSILVAHKCDLPDRWGAALPPTAIRVSSVTGVGLPELQRAIVARLVPELPAESAVFPVTRRQTEQLRTAAG